MSERFHMTKTEEVDDAQERHRRDSASPPPSPAARRTPAVSTPPAPPEMAAAWNPRAVQLARLATAAAALALVLAFFHPAIRAALHGKRAKAADAPPAVQRMYLLVNATPRGATVFLDDVEAGKTPLATNVECKGGAPIQIEITARGYAVYVASLPCTPDGDAEVSPALRREP